MRKLVLIVNEVRSAHNVGSLLRTADAMGVERVYLVGITPYPSKAGDQRLPHIAERVERRISKTALGAERTVKTEHLASRDLPRLIARLKAEGLTIAALEQTAAAHSLAAFQQPSALTLIVGNELTGLDADLLKLTDVQLAIPMLGAKESLNVSVAAGMALYHLRHNPIDKNKL